MKCPVCSGPLKYKNQDWVSHGYYCGKDGCLGFLKCDYDCCRIMSVERAFDLIISENHLSEGWQHKRIKNLLELVHQHGLEDGKKCKHKTVPTFDGLGVRYKCQLCNEYVSE